MSRTWKKRADRQIVGAQRPKDVRPFNGNSGYASRRPRGTLCCLCEKFAVSELPSGLGYNSPVCDSKECISSLKRIAEYNRLKSELARENRRRHGRNRRKG